MAEYKANRDGVRFGDHFFEMNDVIPDSVREQYPGPFDRAVARGWVSVGIEVSDGLDYTSATKSELQDAADRLGIDVIGTGMGGNVLVKDLVAALDG